MLKKITAGFLATVAINANSASFDCQKAATFVEKEICTNSLLGKLDEALSENYKGMYESDSAEQKNP